MQRIDVGRRLAGVCFAAVLALGSTQALSADFAGAPAAIPDNVAAGVAIPFNVSGILGPVTSVRLSIGLDHPSQGDLTATLTAPDGVARLVVFGRVGRKRDSSLGMSANLSGTYVFDDDASTDLWATVAALPDSTGSIVPSGTYRTSSAGTPLSDHGGCSTSLRLAFGGLSGAKVNGTWLLTVADTSSTGVGNVTSALLRIESQPRVFSSGFEHDGGAVGAPPQIGSCRRAPLDFTGTGLSSYVLLRNTGGGSGGAVTWLVQSNDGTSSGAQSSFIHGNASDRFVDGDFDGDAISDAAIWNAATGRYSVRRSSRPGDAPLLIDLGTIGDDPLHVGDYDGDGIDDAAIYRPGALSGDASFTLIRLSGTGALRTLVTGQRGQFPIGGVDYDGDGRADMAMQSNAGGGVARFRIYSGIDGTEVDEFTFGAPTDIVVAGSHTGSAQADATVVRSTAGTLVWTTRDGATGVSQPSVTLGQSATDYTLVGDFDGDGVSDYAVWRRSATPGESRFLVRRSTAPATPLEVQMGQNSDYPLANWRVH